MYESYNELLGAEDCLFINVYTPKVIGLIEKKFVFINKDTNLTIYSRNVI